MRVVLLLYSLALAIGSLQPERPGDIHGGPLHRPLHIVSFAILAALSRIAFREPRRLLLTVLACAAFGAALEFSQRLIYHIGFEWNDLVDDVIGSAAGVAIVGCVRHSRVLLSWTRRHKGSKLE